MEIDKRTVVNITLSMSTFLWSQYFDAFQAVVLTGSTIFLFFRIVLMAGEYICLMQKIILPYLRIGLHYLILLIFWSFISFTV